MKNKQFKYASLKKQLLARKMNGVRFVVWKLSNEQCEFIETCLGYSVEPFLYCVKTRCISHDIRNGNALLREVHYASKNKKYKIIKKLKFQDKKVLDEWDIPYTPFKYKIYLN